LKCCRGSTAASGAAAKGALTSSSHHDPFLRFLLYTMSNHNICTAVLYPTVPLVVELNYLPQTAILASYAGGEQLQTARLITAIQLPQDKIDNNFKSLIFNHINNAIEMNNSMLATHRLAKLPNDPIEFNSIQWFYDFQLSSRIYDSVETCNLFYHGRLFKEFPQSKRLGANAYPLIGLYDSQGIVDPEGKSSDAAWIGRNNLKWADQHVHNVNNDINNPDYHLGSDMAKFCINESEELITLQAVCFNPENRECLISEIIIVHPDLEAAVERLAMQSLSNENIEFHQFLPKFIAKSNCKLKESLKARLLSFLPNS
jgi:hypothetical protein